jgi:hypothetical protein
MKVVEFLEKSSLDLHFSLEQVKEKKRKVVEVERLMLSFKVISMISYPTIICITSHSNSWGFLCKNVETLAHYFGAFPTNNAMKQAHEHGHELVSKNGYFWTKYY